MTIKKLNTRQIKSRKGKALTMLTCYDYQTAQAINDTDLDMILVGDSVGNVILGYDSTVPVTLDVMKIFTSAVRRGAPDKFIIADMPFGTYASFEDGIRNAVELFQQTQAEAIKLEGGHEHHIKLIERLTQNGIAVMGHIGLTPQSVHHFGGYYTHGKDEVNAKRLMTEAKALEQAGAFAVVLECVEPTLATEITQALSIPTIGIGAGQMTDGQVLVINDLLKMGKDRPPAFCQPMANLYDLKKEIITNFIQQTKGHASLS